MRVLYIPFFSNQANHNGCSVFNTMKHFFRAWVEADDNVFVYMPVPSNVKYDPDDILNHPRIMEVPMRMLGNDQYDEKVIVPEELYQLFNTDTGKHYYDVVICDKAQIANTVKLMLSRKFRVGANELTPYITLSQFLINREGRFKDMIEEVEFSQCLGWLSGYNLFENERNAEMSFDLAKKFLLPASVKKIMDNSKVQNIFGLNTRALDPIYQGNSYKAGEELKINFPHRVASHYKFEEILELIDYLFKSGLKIKFIITTPSNSLGKYGMVKTKKMKQAGLPMEIHTGLPQCEFYKIASECHLFVSAIDELQSPNAMYEQTYLGQVGILPYFPWSKHFFPDYPYKWKNFAEAYAWIKEFIENPEPMIKKNLEFRQYLKENYDIYTNSVKVLEWIKTSILPKYKPYDSALSLTKEILEKAGNPKSFTFTELSGFFKKFTDFGFGLEQPTFRKLNKFDFIRAVLALGYRDTCEPELSFTKD